MEVQYTTAEIEQICGVIAARGVTTQTIRGIAALAEAHAGDLSFLGNARYRAEVAKSGASAILVPADFTGEPAPDQTFLLVDNPSVALARLCARLEQRLWPQPPPGVHPSAAVADGAWVAPSASIGPHCVVEPGARVEERVHLQARAYVGARAVVGEGSWLGPGVTIMAECQVGKRARLHAGVVLGSDGFGYEFVGGRHDKVPQIGAVVLGDDVEIGANTTIDRARFGRTLVGDGTKIDNLVQIGHNVRIGRHCILCAQVGVSGSTLVEDYVVLGGQAGVAGHLRLGKGARIGGSAGVTTDIEPGALVNGNPAIPLMLERRIAVLKQRLPALFRRVESLEEQVAGGKKLSPGAVGRNMPPP